MNFIAHGDFRVHSEGRIVVSDIHGPWNLQLLKSWAAEADPIYLRLGRQGVCGAINVHFDSVLTQPECISYHRRLTEFAVNNYRFSASASVVPSGIEGGRLADMILSPICKGLVPFRIFEDFATAKRWVQLELKDR